jgi:calcineurin-like phosphoesterase family protein
MTRRYYCVADLHLEHEKMHKFTFEDGTITRPNPITKLPFASMEEHDEFIIEQWNKTISYQDTVYVLGDVCINSRGIRKLGLLNGRKILVPGNHDIFHYKEYGKYFADIRGCIIRNKVIFSHFHIPEISMARYALNVHGHLHSFKVDHPKYLNVGLEHTNNFCPISLDEIYAYRDSIKNMSPDSLKITPD